MDSKDVVNNFISSQIYTNHQGLTQAENVDKSLKKVVDNLYAGKQETDAQLATIGLKVGGLVTPKDTESTTYSTGIADDKGNLALGITKDGEIETKKFSSKTAVKVIEDNSENLYGVGDNQGNLILIVDKYGNLKTPNFDSRNRGEVGGSKSYEGNKINLTQKNGYDIATMTPLNIGSGSRQGMDIYDNKIVMLFDTGICNIINLTTLQKIASFNLASYDASNHANCANFGKDKANGSDFPYLYISIGKVGNANGFTCSVEKIVKNNGSYSSLQVQKIVLDKSGYSAKGYSEPWDVPTWLIDKERGFLWTFSAIGRTIPTYTPPSQNKYIAHKFRLPNVNEGNVTLTADDVLKECIFTYDINVTQGGTMRDGKIYYCFGFGGGSDYPSAVRVFDTDTNTISSSLNLDGIVNAECEDIAIYNGDLFLNTNSANIYKLTF